jgi:hypothetical protein
MDCEKRMTISVLGTLSFALWLANPALGQSNSELRLKVWQEVNCDTKATVLKLISPNAMGETTRPLLLGLLGLLMAIQSD